MPRHRGGRGMSAEAEGRGAEVLDRGRGRGLDRGREPARNCNGTVQASRCGWTQVES
jgi:hypothetical protein